MKNLYDTDEIRQAADCVELMRTVFNVKERKPGRFDCPWRPGSDSGAVAVEREQWYDHVDKEGGDAIKLVIKGMSKNFLEANVWLGEHYRLTPKQVVRETSKVVAEYIYDDMDGIPLHKKIRYEPKSFSQEHFTADGWKPGLGRTETVLYHLREVVEAVESGRWVFLCEGEKDADNLRKLGFCATTMTDGANKWKPGYTATLERGNVCILPDKDEKGQGQHHAAMVAEQLYGKVNVLKVLYLPGERVKDVSNWIEQGGTAAEFKLLVHETPAYVAGVPATSQRTKELAKTCNQTPFSNFVWDDVTTATGALQRVKRPKLIAQLCDEVLDRFLGFPRRVSAELFDHDRKSGRIRMFGDATSLFSWIQEKSKQPVNWAKIEGAVSMEQLFITLSENVQRYEMITGVPTWPTRRDVYYTHPELPEPSPGNEHLETFLSFFNPASDGSKAMLRAFVAAPMYYKQKVDRPLWVIDSDTAQGSGKTKLAEAVARLYGTDDGDEGEPFWVDVKSIMNEQSADRVWRRLLSSNGRRKRVVLIDNVTDFLKAPSLATLVTQGSISGLAPYGRGEETRPNDLTYIITSNSARLDRDLASRSMFIKVNRPENPDPRWADKLFGYIKQYRLNILSEILGILSKGASQQTEKTYSRFRTWELDVMAPMVGSDEHIAAAIAENGEQQADCDYDQENADEVRKFFRAKVERIFGPAGAVFIPNKLAKKWFVDALPNEIVKVNSIPQILKNWSKASLIQEIVRFTRRQDGIRGMIWSPRDVKVGDIKTIPVYPDEGGL